MWMFLFLLGTGQSQMRVGRLGAVLSGEVPIAALAPLVRLIAHKAPGKCRGLCRYHFLMQIGKLIKALSTYHG